MGYPTALTSSSPPPLWRTIRNPSPAKTPCKAAWKSEAWLLVSDYKSDCIAIANHATITTRNGHWCPKIAKNVSLVLQSANYDMSWIVRQICRAKGAAFWHSPSHLPPWSQKSAPFAVPQKLIKGMIFYLLPHRPKILLMATSADAWLESKDILTF